MGWPHRKRRGGDQVNWFTTAATFRSAFQELEREDGSQYWTFTDEAETSEELTEFVRELHDKEWPNDWRFETIISIIDQIIEHSKGSNDYWEDQSMEIAEALTTIYTGELLQWYADNASRLDYVDQAREDGIIVEANTGDQLTTGQHQAIAQMAIEIIQKLGLLDD